MPVIGQFQISDIARVSFLLHEQWGKIVRLGGLLGRPDLLFVYDADEIEKVCEQNFEKVAKANASYVCWEPSEAVDGNAEHLATHKHVTWV